MEKVVVDSPFFIAVKTTPVQSTSWSFQSLYFEPEGSFMIQDANDAAYAISATSCTKNGGNGNGNSGTIGRELYPSDSELKFHWYYEERRLTSVFCSQVEDTEVIDLPSCTSGSPDIKKSSDSNANNIYLIAGAGADADTTGEVDVRIESRQCPGYALYYGGNGGEIITTSLASK